MNEARLNEVCFDAADGDYLLAISLASERAWESLSAHARGAWITWAAWRLSDSFDADVDVVEVVPAHIRPIQDLVSVAADRRRRDQFAAAVVANA